jgi:hypothetical protein
MQLDGLEPVLRYSSRIRLSIDTRSTRRSPMATPVVRCSTTTAPAKSPMWSHAASASYRQRLDEINRAAPQILRTAHHDFERPSPGTDVGLVTNQLIGDVVLDAGAAYGSGNLVIRWLSGGYYFTVYIALRRGSRFGFLDAIPGDIKRRQKDQGKRCRDS